jgi:hypothetical protein
MEIVYRKKDGEIRELSGRFCNSDEQRDGYIWFWDEDDEQVKSLICNRIESIAHSGKSFKVIGGLYENGNV